MVLMNDIAEIRERKQFLMCDKLIAKHKEAYVKGRLCAKCHKIGHKINGYSRFLRRLIIS